LKLAVTSDGYLGLRQAGQVAITGPIANAQTHMMRARADAILIGSGTAIADDPSLTCRLPGLSERSPARIVLETTNSVCRDSKFIALASQIETFIACPQGILHRRREELTGTSCKFITCDTKTDAGGKSAVALPELLGDLADIGVASLMVEGGKKLAEAFLDNQLVDEFVLYISNKKMADKSAAKINNDWISWPVSPDTVPNGFHISDHWRYGADKAIRIVPD
jgi:diaminohydroxyphosphoribosylaminopyrimidine deaminase/5-amino-6-(5-phosphoribosylamino)uracil reductase